MLPSFGAGTRTGTRALASGAKRAPGGEIAWEIPDVDPMPFGRLGTRMSYSIRPWSDDDRDQVVGLITGIQQREFGLAITADDQPDLLDVTTFYRVPLDSRVYRRRLLGSPEAPSTQATGQI